MRIVVLASAVVLTSFSLLAGCSGGDDGDANEVTLATASSPSSVCADICAKNAECDGEIDVQTCAKSCESTTGNVVGKVRADVFAQTLTCYRGADCRKILGGEEFGSCLDEAIALTVPSAQALSFCDGLSDALDKCDRKIERAACLDVVKTAPDGLIGEAQSCLAKSCSQILPCVDATL